MRLGIRLQLLIALGALLLLAFVPLYVAMASLTRTAMVSVRESSARSLGRAIGGHVMAASRARSVSALQPLLDAQVGEGGVEAIAAYGEDGAPLAYAGTPGGVARLPATVEKQTESVTSVNTSTGAALLVVVPQAARRASGGVGVGAVATLLPIDSAAARAGPLVRLFGLYTGIVALALLVFTYISMTRLVVRPVVQLSDRARRVADGARGIDPRLGGAAELADLGASLSMMTNRLRADEEALRAKVDELEKSQVALRSAQETLVRTERLASVGRLAAGLAHEIGNPIAAILGFQELLLASDFDPEERRDFLQRMKKETERVHHVLRDLLDFAKPAGHSDSLEPGAGDVRRAIEDALALLRPQKGFRGIEMVHEIEDDLPLVALGDERLVQVLLNLLLNASDAVPKSDPRIAVRAEREPGGVRLSVVDNGAGVSQEVRSRLFEPFVTTKDVGKGTGLGLAVCRGLVDAAGGTISVEDAPGGGTCFVLEIPEVAPAEDEDDDESGRA